MAYKVYFIIQPKSQMGSKELFRFLSCVLFSVGSEAWLGDLNGQRRGKASM